MSVLVGDTSRRKPPTKKQLALRKWAAWEQKLERAMNRDLHIWISEGEGMRRKEKEKRDDSNTT